MEDIEKVELLNAFFTPVFTAKIAIQESQTLKMRVSGAENFALAQEDLIRDFLCKPGAHKSMGLCGIHPQGGSWQKWLLNHSLSSLEGAGEWKRCLKAGGNPVWCWFSSRAWRNTWETAGLSALFTNISPFCKDFLLPSHWCFLGTYSYTIWNPLRIFDIQ